MNSKKPRVSCQLFVTLAIREQLNQQLQFQFQFQFKKHFGRTKEL